MIVAIFGTTISPYLFFWQASQEAEESRLSHRARYRSEAARKKAFKEIALDTWVGMCASNFIAFFIIVTTAATLGAHGVTKIETAAQAAEALRPIAGELAFALFAAGIIGTGLLAVPVLAGSAAYAVAEALDFRAAGLCALHGGDDVRQCGGFARGCHAHDKPAIHIHRAGVNLAARLLFHRRGFAGQQRLLLQKRNACR